MKTENANDVILGAWHGGLGDNLQFSTLPEEFYKQQGKETYIWASSPFRNSEIYELVWKHNPYVKGIREGERTAGDLPDLHKSELSNCISNWEHLHGLKPTNKYPKVYYQPKPRTENLSDVFLVDMSAISTNYNLSDIEIQLTNFKSENPNKVYLGVSFNQNFQRNQYQIHVDDIIEVGTIFDYCDIMNESYGILTLHAGQSHLSSAMKQYNPELKSFCFMEEERYQYHKDKSIFLFDNVEYLRY